MTNTTKTSNTAAPQEIDTAALDQVVGAASAVMHEARKQEQGDKLTSEEAGK